MAHEGMVHALKEAHRVLKPNGILIDLRPEHEHRRLGLGEGRSWREVGALHESLDDDFAADRAVARLLQEGLFQRERTLRFQVDRVMDTMDDARDWLADFDQRRSLPSHEPLLKRLERERAEMKWSPRLTVRGPMKLHVLRRQEVP